LQVESLAGELDLQAAELREREGEAEPVYVDAHGDPWTVERWLGEHLSDVASRLRAAVPAAEVGFAMHAERDLLAYLSEEAAMFPGERSA